MSQFTDAFNEALSLGTPEARLLVLNMCNEDEQEARRLLRAMFALERWPETTYDDSRGKQVCEDWDYAAEVVSDPTATGLPWDFPEFVPVPGDDYANTNYFIDRVSGLLDERQGQHEFDLPAPGEWQEPRWRRVVKALSFRYLLTPRRRFDPASA